ncbi:MAG: glutamine--fructose-6-phosphate transaminase (isomerizing) [Elusimicrobiota bacterium]|jgi:glucosamine--fructose-6-phosphate aminotransferase (isomerizing)|nr:glutamine--fructose-6-phosphate transaminase (isomerizing) [Elusimicrobiota bacterium]
MCGIVGYIGQNNASDIIFEGLRKLEYRGYDSAGIAVILDNNLHLRRSVGKLSNLKEVLSKKPLHSNIGIGHTRWATHGKPSEENAHPHTDETNSIVIVHNGIIENYAELKNNLQKEGAVFKSETDTEVMAYLIKKYYKNNLFDAVKKALKEIRGSYALGVLCKDEPDKIICARAEAPLIIGVGREENFIASDIPALLAYTKDMIFLEDGDIAQISADSIIIENSGSIVKRQTKTILWDAVQAEKAGFRHFMLKEIFEQPQTIEDTIRGRIYPDECKIIMDAINFDLDFIKGISQAHIVACGTAYYSGLVAKFLFENFCKISVDVDIASEFRYRQPVLNENSLVIFISQSGETADTLAALKLAKSKNCKTLAICNVVGSTISRQADNVLYTHCGPEIGVASTKAFTGQLAALYILALDWAQKRNTLSKDLLSKYMKELWNIPLKTSNLLKNTEQISKIAKLFANKKDFLYLGRHINYPIALEGALKLKEISYIHAEGYPAGEMKHGPIALIDENMPIVVIMPQSSVYEKILSNIEEAKARGAVIIAIASQGDILVKEHTDYQFFIPQTDEFFSPILSVIPMQLLAYHIAVSLGCDVDQPRNLAKSVTVE